MLLTLLLLWLAQAGAPAPAEVRTVLAAINDEKGAPLRALSLEDVAVVEDGVAREPVRVEPDTRPLTVALLVDTSQSMGTSFRLHLVDAVESFLRHLPEGSRYALWTTGDRPVKRVDYTADPAEAAPALRRVAPTGGNTLLDALVEAARDLKIQEGARSAVVVVSGAGPETSHLERNRVVDEAGRSGAIFSAVHFQEGVAAFDDQVAADFVLDQLTRKTGGLLESPVSAMGAVVGLRKIATDLDSLWRISYATLPEAGAKRIEISVAQPRTRVRVMPKARSR
jgi:hypothetical protein